MNLKQILLLNAITSGTTGILLMILPNVFAVLFETHQTTPFIQVGLFLTLFALFVLFTAFKTDAHVLGTKIIIALDTAWVIASIAATIALFSSISIAGTVIILAVAAWVGMMAYLQRQSLKNIQNYGKQ